MGLLVASGSNVQHATKAIMDGQHAISHLKNLDVSKYPTQLAAEITFPLPVVAAKITSHPDRGHQLLLSAVKEALLEAGLLNSAEGLRIGVIVGTSLAGMVSMQSYDKALFLGKKASLKELVNQPLHVSADIVAKEFGLTGPRQVISTACTASTIAIGCAIAMLRNNQVDIVVAAGCDPLTYISYAGFSSMRNMSDRPCSPYSINEGLTLGEGAGALVLELKRSALKRQLNPVVFARDYMFTADAYHSTLPDPKGRGNKYLLQQLLKKSDTQEREVDYINLHGTGTKGNDITETKVIDKLFYQNGHHVPTSSLKGAIGHTLGAAGISESVLTIMALQESKIPPTANFTQAREGCVLDYVPNDARSEQLDTAIVQNFAFGGNNAAVLFSKNEGKNTILCNRRVVVTGCSAITPLGNSFQEIIENIRLRKSALDDFYSEDYQRYFKVARLRSFNSRQYIKANTRRMDRFSQLIASASALALHDSGLNLRAYPDLHVGFISGTMLGHAESNYKFHREILSKDPGEVNPFLFPNTVTNAGTGQAAILNRFKGCNIALSMGQASGLSAINLAYCLIKDGLHPMIIAGGADELTDYALFNFYKSGITRSCRDGPVSLIDKLVLNEGAAYFAIENYDHAVNRGAKIYAEILACHDAGAVEIKSTKESLMNTVNKSIETLLEELAEDIKVDAYYSSSLNYKGIVKKELELITEIFSNGIRCVNLHDMLGMSALTSAVSFGLACVDQHACSLISAASIGGAFYTTWCNNVRRQQIIERA